MPPTEPTKALYVRIPVPDAERLDRAAEELQVSKRQLISALVARHLEPGDETLTQRLRDTAVVGHHAFTPAAPDDVLTLAEAAQLLRVDEAELRALAERGELPGRRIGAEWRFARAALLGWLGVS